jgi:drug/metabolite transporter (DMT)-like permease
LRKETGFLLLLALSVIWGLAFVAIRRADFELSPVNLALLRWFIAGGVFLVLIPLYGKSKAPFEKKDIARLLLVSAANVGGYHISLNYAETIVDSGLAGLLISFGPLFAVVLSAVFLKEKVGKRLVSALLLGILGAIMLALSSGDFSFKYITGPIAVIFAAFSYAAFAVALKPLVAKYGVFWTAGWAAVLGTAMMLPLISGSLAREVAGMSLDGWLSVLYLSLLSSVVGYFIFYTLVSSRAVSSLSIQLYLIPVVSVVGGALILGESVTPVAILGGVALLGGVYLATGVKRQRSQPTKSLESVRDEVGS